MKTMAPDDRVGAQLDEQDRIAILQMLTLTHDQRLNYFADEVDFETDTAEVAWDDGPASTRERNGG